MMAELQLGASHSNYLIVVVLAALAVVAVVVALLNSNERFGFSPVRFGMKLAAILLAVGLALGIVIYQQYSIQQPPTLTAVAAPVVEDHRAELQRHARALVAERVTEAELEALVRQAAETQH